MFILVHVPFFFCAVATFLLCTTSDFNVSSFFDPPCSNVKFQEDDARAEELNTFKITRKFSNLDL